MKNKKKLKFMSSFLIILIRKDKKNVKNERRGWIDPFLPIAIRPPKMSATPILELSPSFILSFFHANSVHGDGDVSAYSSTKSETWADGMPTLN